jgi:intracellular septation protein
MKFLFDFFPVLVFFIAYKFFDIYTATAAAIVASFVQVGWSWLRHRKIENAHLITLVLIVVLGGLTLYLQDEMFIKWKPTVVNWLFAAVFFGSQFVGRKPLVQRLMGHAVALPHSMWLRLNLGWTVFFVALGIANLYVVYSFDTSTWVNFKLFGMTALTFAFVLAQAFYVARFVKPQPENSGTGE